METNKQKRIYVPTLMPTLLSYFLLFVAVSYFSKLLISHNGQTELYYRSHIAISFVAFCIINLFKFNAKTPRT